MDIEWLATMNEKIDNGELTPLEIFNLKMYVAFQTPDVMKRVIEREIESIQASNKQRKSL